FTFAPKNFTNKIRIYFFNLSTHFSNLELRTAEDTNFFTSRFSPIVKLRTKPIHLLRRRSFHPNTKKPTFADREEFQSEKPLTIAPLSPISTKLQHFFRSAGCQAYNWNASDTRHPCFFFKV
ncbi:hypothetical protein LINPERPRIM_LOCUS39852, partial [Linum perenne]